jgi:hypothetical protein
MPLFVVSFSADPLAVSKLSLHRMLVDCETKERAREVVEGEIYPRSDSSDAAERRLPSAKQAWGGGASFLSLG